MQPSGNLGTWICILSQKQTCHPYLLPPVRPWTRNYLFKRWPWYFLYFRSKEQSWKKTCKYLHASSESRADGGDYLESWLSHYSTGRGQDFTPSPGLTFSTASSGLPEFPPRITWFSGHQRETVQVVLYAVTQRILLALALEEFLGCVLDKSKWWRLLKR